MSTRTKDGLAFDLGANHLCNLYTEMQKYCKAFGIPQGGEADSLPAAKDCYIKPVAVAR